MASLNLDHYKGNDLYSDGDVEIDILEIIKHNKDYTEIIQKDGRWPVVYHLTPVRRNLLEWFPFNSDGSLLEIGGGCGALTGLFTEKLKSVTVVELSKRRAEIIQERFKNNSNLEIIAGNLNDIAFKCKFDYVTLIGVLEYAGKFTSGKNPYLSFLKKTKNLVNPDGSLIIAIENKFGMKYWAGARDDHTGRHFDGIENYPYATGVRTFSKNELNDLLIAAGFTDLKFYYPMPDYKIPNTIYSDNYLPDDSTFFPDFSPNFDQDRYALFRENIAFNNIIKNNKFDFFANSFLVIAK